MQCGINYLNTRYGFGGRDMENNTGHPEMIKKRNNAIPPFNPFLNGQYIISSETSFKESSMRFRKSSLRATTT